VVRVVRSASASRAIGATLSRSDLVSGSIRQAPDGWHAVLRIQGAQHHLWLKEAPQLGVSYAAELPLDSDFEIRAHASNRLWRAINGRLPGPAFHQLSAQRANGWPWRCERSTVT